MSFAKVTSLVGRVYNHVYNYMTILLSKLEDIRHEWPLVLPWLLIDTYYEI